MGALEQAVEQAIKKIAGNMQLKQVLTGTASEVTDTTCTVTRENAPTLYGVRLNAIDDDLESQVTVYPADGSHVIVAIIEGMKTEAVVLRCSEVAKVKIGIGTQSLVIDKDGFVFNEGTAGMVNLPDMVSWMSKVYTDLQTLKTLLSTTVVAGNGAPLGAVFTPTVSNPTEEMFEDSKIKH
jgi:hypothetical protein